MVKLSITIPDNLSVLFYQQCKKLNRTRSGYIAYLIKQELEKSLNVAELKKLEEK